MVMVLVVGGRYIGVCPVRVCEGAEVNCVCLCFRGASTVVLVAHF